MLDRHLESSAQLPVRVSLLLIVLLVLLAETLGLDVLLGAFAAGIVVRLFSASGGGAVVRGKLEAIGFGFLIPIFFVVSGIQFDLHVFVHNPKELWRVGLFLVLMLVARGAPVYLIYRRVLTPPERFPMALLSATGLPLIVVITSIATAEGRMIPANAAALVAAGHAVGAAVPGPGHVDDEALGALGRGAGVAGHLTADRRPVGPGSRE